MTESKDEQIARLERELRTAQVWAKFTSEGAINLIRESARERDEAKQRADALERALRNCVEALTDDRIGTTQMDDPDLYRKFNKAVSIALAAFPPDHPETLEAQGHKARGEPLAEQPANDPQYWYQRYDGGTVTQTNADQGANVHAPAWPVQHTTWRNNPAWMIATDLEHRPTVYLSEAPNEWTYIATLPNPHELVELLRSNGHALGENYHRAVIDQPADAGDPDCCAKARADERDQPRSRCTHTRLVKDRCPICGPLDDDNRPTLTINTREIEMDLTSNKIVKYIAKNEPVAITELAERFQTSWPIMRGMIKHLRHSGQVEGNDGNLKIRSKNPTSKYEYRTLNFSGNMYGGSDNPSCQANQWLEKNPEAEVLGVSIYTEAKVQLSTMAMAVRIPLNACGA